MATSAFAALPVDAASATAGVRGRSIEERAHARVSQRALGPVLTLLSLLFLYRRLRDRRRHCGSSGRDEF
ncbi:MAG: hypothetical protein JWN57_2706 [Frankiales bacterium]|jgi:hypothetical protein|nr:hypothetical protein [Frankiales bacterium]